MFYQLQDLHINQKAIIPIILHQIYYKNITTFKLQENKPSRSVNQEGAAGQLLTYGGSYRHFIPNFLYSWESLNTTNLTHGEEEANIVL